MNTDKAVHLGHSLSIDANHSIVNSTIKQYWRSVKVIFC